MRSILGGLLLLTVAGSASHLWSTSRVEIVGVSVPSASARLEQATVRYKLVYPDGRTSECQANIDVLAASAVGVTLLPHNSKCDSPHPA